MYKITSICQWGDRDNQGTDNITYKNNLLSSLSWLSTNSATLDPDNFHCKWAAIWIQNCFTSLRVWFESFCKEIKLPEIWSAVPRLTTRRRNKKGFVLVYISERSFYAANQVKNCSLLHVPINRLCEGPLLRRDLKPFQVLYLRVCDAHSSIWNILQRAERKTNTAAWFILMIRLFIYLFIQLRSPTKAKHKYNLKWKFTVISQYTP